MVNTDFIVFRLTRPWLKPTIYCTQSKHANHCITDAVITINTFIKRTRTQKGHLSLWTWISNRTITFIVGCFFNVWWFYSLWYCLPQCDYQFDIKGGNYLTNLKKSITDCKYKTNMPWQKNNKWATLGTAWYDCSKSTRVSEWVIVVWCQFNFSAISWRKQWWRGLLCTTVFRVL